MANIRVNTKLPFEIVYSIYLHPQLGYMLDLVAVQIMGNGEYSLVCQTLHQTTAKDFNASQAHVQALKYLDETEPETLIKKFFPQKKSIRSSDFFNKYYSPELHQNIRPYIEQRLLKVLEQIGDQPLFLAKDKNLTHTKLSIASEKASILFHFRRNEQATHYFATIKLGDNSIRFSQNNSDLIIQEPAWLLTGKQIITFKKDTEGNKIKPFLSKKFIAIPKQSEAVYFEKFVRPLIEHYDVYAEGFDIVSERFRAHPSLKLTPMTNGIGLSLHFNYGPYQFPYHSKKMVSVSLEKQQDQYIFHRVKRSKNWEESIVLLLHKMGLKSEQSNLFISALPQSTILQIIHQHIDDMKANGMIIDQTLLEKPYHIGNHSIQFKMSKNKDWFDLEAIVQFGPFAIPFVQLKQHILNGRREFELPDKSIAIIPEEWFTKYSGLFDFSDQKTDGLRFKKHHFGLLQSILNEEQGIVNKDIPLFTEDIHYPLPKGLKAQLRPYQATGYYWLCFMQAQGFGACLADDMGLGKTLQVITYLQSRVENSSNALEAIPEEPSNASHQQLALFGQTTEQLPIKQQGSTHLVVVPTSLIYNWVSEAKKFSRLNVYVHTGFNRNKQLIDVYHQYDVIVSSYGTVRNDIDQFSQMHFDTIILDESQAIKNPSSQTAISINQLQGKFKIVMTGTPVENSITDLWSQIHFLNPGILGNFNFFNRKFVSSIEKDKNAEETKYLRDIVKPFILRRTKEQVASDLPNKTEKIVYCEMSEEQKQTYESIKSQFRNELLSSIESIGYKKSNLLILNGLIKLRQIANHPILSEAEYIGSSGKFDQITQSLLNVINTGHKVLVFSQFVQHLQLLSDFLNEKQIPFYCITGQVNAKDRKLLVDEFQKNKATSVFLISLKAGGTGLNLTAADYVFLLDPWWNPAVERQAMDRTHRIGQDKPVIVYKFITKDSIEEKIVHLQLKKQQVSDDILDTETQFVNNLEENTLNSLLQ